MSTRTHLVWALSAMVATITGCAARDAAPQQPSAVLAFEDDEPITAGAGGAEAGDAAGRPLLASSSADAEVTVSGPLDREVIRRIVRPRLNEVRHCYVQALARDPNAAGRVTIQFVIASSGKVASAVVHHSTLKDRAAGTCIASAVRRWPFPKSSAGGVVVTYPFVLAPG